MRTQAAGVARVIQPRVLERAAGAVQIEGEVTHGRQKQRRARLAGPHMGGVFGRLGHPHGVQTDVEAVKGRDIDTQLVTQHDDE